MLAIARALMLRPRLLLLDEPSFGLAPLVVQEIFAHPARDQRATSGISMLLVEQNANLALDSADHAYLLETGRIALAGAAAEIGARRGGAPRLSRLLTSVTVDASCTRSFPASRRAASMPRVALALVMIYQATHLREFRAGRDGDVLDLHRLDADRGGLPYWVAFVATVAVSFVDRRGDRAAAAPAAWRMRRSSPSSSSSSACC